MAGRPLNEVVEAGWAEALEPVAERIAQMGEFLRKEIAEGRQYLPSGANVLRAFKQPFDEVKVLIVGQDPYPTPGHPVGLCFSVAADVRPLPGSLLNIYKEMDERPRPPAAGQRRPHARGPSRACCCSTGCSPSSRASPPRTGARAGKRSPSRPSSALVARDKPLVAILWGRDARNLRADARRGAAHRVGAPVARCRPAAASSAPARSAAPTSFSSSRARRRSSGSCPRLVRHHE